MSSFRWRLNVVSLLALVTCQFDTPLSPKVACLVRVARRIPGESPADSARAAPSLLDFENQVLEIGRTDTWDAGRLRQSRWANCRELLARLE